MSEMIRTSKQNWMRLCKNRIHFPMKHTMLRLPTDTEEDGSWPWQSIMARISRSATNTKNMSLDFMKGDERQVLVTHLPDRVLANSSVAGEREEHKQTAKSWKEYVEGGGVLLSVLIGTNGSEVQDSRYSGEKFSVVRSSSVSWTYNKHDGRPHRD